MNMDSSTPSPPPSEQDTSPSPSPTTAQALPYPSCQVPPARPDDEWKPGAKKPGQPRQWKPIATRVIIALNALIWLIMTIMGGSTNPYVLLRFGAKVNLLIVQGQIWRLVTPIFLHIGIAHLVFNLYALYVIGPRIECFFGHARFLSIYMLSGIYGVLFSFAFSSSPSAGASGAIFGLIGTQAIFFYCYRNTFGQRGRRQFYSTISVIAFNLVLTFTTPNIDIWGHIGGLLAGAVLGWGLTPRYAVTMTEAGPRLIDLNHPRQWGAMVLGAVILLAVSTCVAISLQAASV